MNTSKDLQLLCFFKLCFDFSIECFSAMKDNRTNTGKIGWTTIPVGLELRTLRAKISIAGHLCGRHAKTLDFNTYLWDAKTLDFNTYIWDLSLQLTIYLSWANDLFLYFYFLLCKMVIKQWISQNVIVKIKWVTIQKAPTTAAGM